MWLQIWLRVVASLETCPGGEMSDHHSLYDLSRVRAGHPAKKDETPVESSAPYDLNQVAKAARMGRRQLPQATSLYDLEKIHRINLHFRR